jgi:hypothetical protein
MVAGNIFTIHELCQVEVDVAVIHHAKSEVVASLI